jgi:pimeloyl-ACP methyl ester carboxylesterase
MIWTRLRASRAAHRRHCLGDRSLRLSGENIRLNLSFALPRPTRCKQGGLKKIAPGTASIVALAAVLAGCQGGANTPSAEASAGWITERVDVGGHKLNLRCKGTGSPALVFENGLGGNLGTWLPFVANAFPSVRTCVYDRVNTGASDRVPARRTGKDSVHDLHALLDVAAVPPPFLLVGHSFGGLLSAMYAGSYPTEVVGLVLIDPTPPTDADSVNLIPERDRAAAAAAQENNTENLAFDVTLEQAKTLVPQIPNIPVLVLAATRGLSDLPSTWPVEDMRAASKKQMEDFTAAVPRGELRYVDTGHFIQQLEPQLVIREVQRTLDSVR